MPSRFNAGLEAQWAAKQTEAAVTEVQTPGHLILNFDIQSTDFKIMNTALRLMAGVENILNKAYKNHLFGTRGLDYYEPGRNVFVKATLGL